MRAPVDFARFVDTAPLGRLETEPAGRVDVLGRAGVLEVAGRDDRVPPAAFRDELDDEPLPEALEGFLGLDGVVRGAGFEAGRALDEERGAGCDFELGAGRGFADEERLLPEEDDEEEERFADDGADELERLDDVRLFPLRSICTGRCSRPIESSREPARTGD